MDGTIVDSIGKWQEMNHIFLQKNNIYLKGRIYPELKEGNTILQGAEFFKTKFSLEDSIEDIVNQWTKIMIPFYKKFKVRQGLVQVLQFLKQREIKIVIGTSNSKEMAKILINKNKISEYFEFIVDGYDVRKGKPFPDIFLKATDRLNIDPSKSLVFEDSACGVLAAKNAKMDVMIIKDDYADFDYLKKIATYHSKNYKQTLNILKNIL